MKQPIFILILLITLTFFLYSIARIIRLFKFTQSDFPIRNHKQRVLNTLKTAFGQKKIFRYPLVGFMHAIVFWGFLIITIGSLEMVIDGITNQTRSFSFLVRIYPIITAGGEIFASVIILFSLAFIIRRSIINIRRFKGKELTLKSKWDAAVALIFIIFLMVSLLGTNIFYLIHTLQHQESISGYYPISQSLALFFNHLSSEAIYFWHELSWWSHILLIFIFANILPYSKHFHILVSIPNVYLSRPNPIGQLQIMEDVKREVELMYQTTLPQAEDTESPRRFGVQDAKDTTWKNYLDSLACTECGRCTESCPANITGKKLSPRKLFIDLRACMKTHDYHLRRKEANNSLTLLRGYISEEELWACTTCNACIEECPVNINHINLIINMRRFLVMEEGAAPAPINFMFSAIENNGAPWQLPAEDRINWTKNLYLNEA